MSAENQMNALRAMLGIHSGTKTPTRKIPIKMEPCPICGAPNPSHVFRCKKCDSAIIRKRPAGDKEQQIDYIAEYIANQRELQKLYPALRPKPKA